MDTRRCCLRDGHLSPGEGGGALHSPSRRRDGRGASGFSRSPSPPPKQKALTFTLLQRRSRSDGRPDCADRSDWLCPKCRKRGHERRVSAGHDAHVRPGRATGVIVAVVAAGAGDGPCDRATTAASMCATTTAGANNNRKLRRTRRRGTRR